MSDIEYAYIAVEPCGCVTAATVDNPRHQRDTARDIAKWVRDGRIVERVTVAAARERLTLRWPCEHVAQPESVRSDQLALALSAPDTGASKGGN